MKYRRGTAVLLPFMLTPVLALAGPGANTPPPHISKQTRMEVIRTFTSELVYVRAPFPMGKTGLKLRKGEVSPSGPELQQLITMWGPAVKPGDQARITQVILKDNYIRFEINGGPVKKQKWYQHIQVGGAGGTVPVAPSDSSANPRGSFVDLFFDRYVPEIAGPELKEMLRPVFDFNAKSAVEAYLETVPPNVKQAIQNHHVLVGMNREMVTYAKGRPPKKIREKNEQTEYEDWIYGEPPQDVDFVRFVGDEVVRVETMKMGGQKIVRTDREVVLQPTPTVAKEGQPGPRPANAPTLRRPGEDLPNSSPTSLPAGGVNQTPPISPQPPPSPNPNGGSSPPNLNANGSLVSN